MVMTVTKGQVQRVTRETADFIADTWVDYALFSQAVARGKLPVDSASVAEAVWPELAELKGTHFHDTLMSRRAAMSDTAADSLYHQPDVRLLQHILFSARNAPPPVKEATRKKAEAALGRIRKGASFAQLASELSEDPGSKADSGYLPPGPRGRFVARVRQRRVGAAAGADQRHRGDPVRLPPDPPPGDRRGARALHRLPARSRGRRGGLDLHGQPRRGQRHQVGRERRRHHALGTGLRGGVATLRQHDRDATRVGRVTVQEFLRWVRALPPQYLQQLKSADDSTLLRFARVVTQNTLLLRQADAAGIQPSQLEWKNLERQYLSQLDTLKGEMGLTGNDFSDSTVAAGEREKVAGIKMEQYFDQLINGKARLRPLPSALASLLRERLPFQINQAGVGRAVDMAKEAKAKADSAAGPGPVRRAPGGPPIPGMNPPGGRHLPPGRRRSRRRPPRRRRHPTPRPGARRTSRETRC